jgi:hypothetical protein
VKLSKVEARTTSSGSTIDFTGGSYNNTFLKATDAGMTSLGDNVYSSTSASSSPRMG